MSVVIGTDLSAASEPLLRLAGVVVKGRKAALVHSTAAEIPWEEQEARKARLHAEAEQLRAQGVEVEEIFQVNIEPADLIASVAFSSDAELVVLGTSARHHRLGSVARDVVSRSPIPVLIQRGAGAPIPGDQVRLFVGLDSSPASAQALSWAVRQPNMDVHLAHVWSPLAAADRFALGKAINPDAPEGHVLSAIVRDLRAIPNTGELPLHMAPLRGSDDPAMALYEVAKGHRADVVVVGVHSRKADALAPGSLLGELLELSDLPIIAVPDRIEKHPLPRHQKVVVAVDFSDASAEAVAHAFALAGPNGTVHLTHVMQPNWDQHEKDEWRWNALKEDMLRLVSEACQATGAAVQAHVPVHANPAKGLSALAETVSADVILVGARPHSALHDLVVGSFVQSLLRTTGRPVMVIHPRA